MLRSVLRSLVALGMGVALASTALAAGDPVAGKTKFSGCASCHTAPGYIQSSNPPYHAPRLAGQHADDLLTALNAYQNGERQHPVMHTNSFPLNAQDMQDVTAFLASLRGSEPPAPVRGNADAGKAKSGTCTACHGIDGNGPVTTYPRLAGQYEDYLRKALADYQSGARRNEVMKGIVLFLSPRDLDDLAAWFASQPNGLSSVPHN